MRKQFCKVENLNYNPKKLTHVRYGDNLIVGIIGSRNDAFIIKKKIHVFLKDHLDLTCNDKKTFIINFNIKFVKFLGVYIKGS